MIFQEYFVRNPQMQFSHIGQDIIMNPFIRNRYTKKISEINLQANPYRTDAQAGILVKGEEGRGGLELDTAQVLT